MNIKELFVPADILLPKETPAEKWAVIACDQFTSQPQYWENVKETVGDYPSALHVTLPEIFLKGDYDCRIKNINDTMKAYVQDGVFTEYPSAFVYVERTMKNGKIRKGIVGVLDLEQYDYLPGSAKSVRATEKTVIERIPPRKKIRENAPIELSHILLLCDDPEKLLIEQVTAKKDSLQVLYDFDCMEGGGHLTGWLLNGAAVEEFESQLEQYAAWASEKYKDCPGDPLLFAVGDGNHSLATAKACYEQLKTMYPGEDLLAHPARYAMVELENIHDEAQEFEPIHRIVCGVDPKELLAELEKKCGIQESTEPAQKPETVSICWCAGTQNGTVQLKAQKGQLPIGILQSFLDDYLSKNAGEIDYIHGDEAVLTLAKADQTIGFLLPAMEKSSLFPGIVADGVLPRKTFSMGHAEEKRYYMEARKITN